MAIAAAANTIAIATATRFETRPEAIGRFFLVGWYASADASRISLKIYVLLEIVQNAQNARIAENKASGFFKRFAKTMGVKTRIFLYHCLTRIRRMNEDQLIGNR
jgi:hypothetical protein